MLPLSSLPMTSTPVDGAPKVDHSSREDNDSPPPDPVLQALPPRTSFFANANDVDRVTEIRLQVEFPMQNNNKKNNVADYFKRLITVLFAAEPGITLLNWQDPNLNPIQRSMNLQGTEDVISQYFTGMQIHHNRKKIIGYVKITSPIPFWQIKKDQRFWNYIIENRIYVRPTTLSDNVHANIGWLLFSHPDFTNHKEAISDLRNRMKSDDLEFELIPQTISYPNDDNVKISTKALKVRSNFKDKERVEQELKDCLKKGTYDERLTEYSNTNNFKLIPFNKNIVPPEAMIDYIRQQNTFLKTVYAISVINLGFIDGIFSSSDSLELKTKKRSNDQCNADDNSDANSNTMDESQDDSSIDSYEESFLQKFDIKRQEGLFTSYEKGRKNQYYLLTTKDNALEAEDWIDNTLDFFLQKYGTNECQKKYNLDDDSDLPRREKRTKINSSDAAYFKTIPLRFQTNSDDSTTQPPESIRSKKRRSSIVEFHPPDNAWKSPPPIFHSGNPAELKPTNMSSVINNNTSEDTSALTTKDVSANSTLMNTLSSMRADFKDSIDKANKARESSFCELRNYVKATAKNYESIFKQQDELNKSFKKSQLTMDNTIAEHTKNYQDLRAEVASLTVSVNLLIAQNDSIAKNKQANYDSSANYANSNVHTPAKTSNANSITPHPHFNVDTGFSPLRPPTTLNTLYQSEVPGSFPPSLADRAKYSGTDRNNNTIYHMQQNQQHLQEQLHRQNEALARAQTGQAQS